MTTEKVLTEHARATELAGQMQANLERMRREGATTLPALDRKSPDNAGKTQYEIDQGLYRYYQSMVDGIVKRYPKLFEEVR